MNKISYELVLVKKNNGKSIETVISAQTAVYVVYVVLCSIIQTNIGRQKKKLIIPKGNQKSSIEEGQTTQWPNEKGQRTFYKTNTQN